MIADLLQLVRRKGVDDFVGRVAERPQIQVPDETIVNGFNAVWDTLWSNIMPPLGQHTDIWARPAPKFPAAYLWDSCFISQAWKIWDPSVALRILKPFVDFQAPDGRMPHMVFLGRKVSDLSNPPFLAWAVNSIANYWDLNGKDHDKRESVKFFVEPLKKFIDWRKNTRYNSTYKTYFWSHSYESGIDNSPRFTTVDEKVDLGTNHLGAVDLNAEIMLQIQSLIQISKRTGFDSFESPLKSLHSELAAAVEQHLWDDDAGYYTDIDFQTGKRRPIDTIASYFFLTADGLNAAHLQKLLDRLRDPQKYNCQMPLVTVARDSPDFIKDMWRGPIWLNTAYLVVEGMKHQQHYEVAGDFAYRLCKGVYYTWKNEGSFYEFYDPDRYDLKDLNRKKGNLYKAITLGTKPVKKFAGWTAVANALLVESVFGLTPNEGKWQLQPHIPEDWLANKEPLRLIIPALQIELEIHPNQAQLDIAWSLADTKETYSIKNHEKRPLNLGQSN